jgi:hypothetical protein
MSVVMPRIVWPAPRSGEPGSGRRFVAEPNIGSTLIELASVPVSAFQAANVSRSKNGCCATVAVPIAPTAAKCDDGPDVYRSL